MRRIQNSQPLPFPQQFADPPERATASNSAKDAETFCTFAHICDILSVNEAACRLMEVALPMLAEQLSWSAVEQRINNGYTGCRAKLRRLRKCLSFSHTHTHIHTFVFYKIH